MKNRRTMRPAAELTVPASAVGIAPRSKQEAKVTRGPKRSHAGPATKRTRRVAARAMMLEFAISFWVRRRSALMVTVNNGGKAYHERNAIMKPNHENVCDWS